MLKRLNGSWYLTDGILPPVRLDAPARVDQALRGAGILADGESAADLLKNEWIYRREWRYSLAPEGGFPADGRAYLTLFGLHGEWTALLDGRELARGDDTEAEIALPAGEHGTTLTLAFAVPAAKPLWPRVGLDGGCLLRTVGSAAISSLSLNVPDDAPWTARTFVRAEAAGACDLRYTLEIGGERTETIVHETLSSGENLFEHAVHEPARPAAFASGINSSERAGALSFGAISSERTAAENARPAALAFGINPSERAGTLSFGAISSERTAAENVRPAALANETNSSKRAAIAVSLRAEILSGGAVSDVRDARLCLPANDAAPRGFAGADAVSASRAAEIGANALCAPDASRARMAAAEHGLTFVPYHSLATQRAARACQRYEALLKLAGDESRVLDPALWRLTGCDMDAPELISLRSQNGGRDMGAPELISLRSRDGGRGMDASELTRLCSPDGDFEEVCRRSRYRQAISLRDAAEHARMKRVPFLLDGARDDAPACASGALFDLDGAARPAYFALADAWKSEHAFVLPPESFPADGIVSVPVFYLSDEKMPPCTVNVRACSMDGQELITAGFPVPGRATDVVGRLCVEMPEDGLLLLRASVLRGGACVSRSDRLIALNEECLSALRPVQLLPDASTLRNASTTVAVGVSVPAARYFGALLPGETLPLDEPRLTAFEALNPLM